MESMEIARTLIDELKMRSHFIWNNLDENPFDRIIYLEIKRPITVSVNIYVTLIFDVNLMSFWMWNTVIHTDQTHLHCTGHSDRSYSTCKN